MTGLATGVLAAAMGAHTACGTPKSQRGLQRGLSRTLNCVLVWRCDGGGSDGGGQSACIVRTISEPCLTR